MLGIDVAIPRLSWQLQTSQSLSPATGVLSPNTALRGLKQAAYQILVASSEELLKKDTGDLWDSGKVESDQQNQIEYAGKPLASRIQCFWKVKVWTTKAAESGGLSPESNKSSTGTWSPASSSCAPQARRRRSHLMALSTRSADWRVSPARIF